VTINLATAPNVQVGEQIYLAAPSAAVNGISQANLTGFFTVTAVSGNQVTFTAGAAATGTGPVNDAGNIRMMPPYNRVGAGEKDRTRDGGELQVDFTGNIGSAYYDVTVNVSVIGNDGVVNTAPVTYRVTNNEQNLLNQRYDATAIGAPGSLVLPQSSQPSLRAILVDANGNELPKINGKYSDEPGVLKLVGGDGSTTYSVAINELNSKQLGQLDEAPPVIGSQRGFSHFFGLNDFFLANAPTATGDTLRNSAYNLKVEDRIIDNPNLIATGTMTRTNKSTATGNREVYTLERYAGDNALAQQMARLSTDPISFDAAGGLPILQVSLQSYSSEFLGFISQRTAEISDNAQNAQILYDGFKSKLDAVSGVNLDEELANTVVLQNNYSATARVLTTVNKMYEDLLQSF
jgi:flagellar hook-associated protein FlgK